MLLPWLVFCGAETLILFAINREKPAQRCKNNIHTHSFTHKSEQTFLANKLQTFTNKTFTFYINTVDAFTTITPTISIFNFTLLAAQCFLCMFTVKTFSKIHLNLSIRPGTIEEGWVGFWSTIFLIMCGAFCFTVKIAIFHSFLHIRTNFLQKICGQMSILLQKIYSEIKHIMRSKCFRTLIKHIWPSFIDIYRHINY